ncbi:DHHC palmitoyltransferase domain-containing protein [Phthorimaea operculella]|nr:DHHC palmitoyltransferase domain-containing protein [Phthorimaea operculella]
MIFKFTSVKNELLRRMLRHAFYITIVVVLIPAFFYFELCVVAPPLSLSSTELLVHYTNAAFFLMNIIGNIIYGMFTDTSIKGRLLNNKNYESWDFCSVCECYRPPRAWHCNTCNICILKRDHHCPYFATCVGYYNFRYFLMFCMHTFIVMLYCFCYNIRFIALFLSWDNGLIILKFIFPFIGLIISSVSESLVMFLLFVNSLVVCFTGFLFFYHLTNVLNGRTEPEVKESNRKKNYDKGWKLNLVEVLGKRWYLTWVSPFIQSPLPGNGIDWDIDEVDKDKIHIS